MTAIDTPTIYFAAVGGLAKLASNYNSEGTSA
jgi:hypothetical protein